jgi:hypothetical protein
MILLLLLLATLVARSSQKWPQTCAACLWQNYDMKVWCKTQHVCLPWARAAECKRNNVRTLLECRDIYPDSVMPKHIVTDPNVFHMELGIVDPKKSTF